MTSKNKKVNESLLHQVLFHPHIGQLTLELLEVDESLSLMSVDKRFRKTIPRLFKKLEIHTMELFRLLSGGITFPNVLNLEIYGTSKKNIFLDQKQFSQLQQLYFRSLTCIQLQLPTLQSLILSSSLCVDTIWSQYQTLRSFYGTLDVSTANDFLNSQPHLQEIELILHADSKIHLVLCHRSIRTFICHGKYHPFVTIPCIKDMELLDLENVMCFVSEQLAIASSMRWMSLDTFEEDSTRHIIGNTKFPNLNFFRSSFYSQDEYAQRVYRECIERNQTQIEPYSHDKRRSLMVQNNNLSANFYCNECLDIKNLILSQTESQNLEVFVRNVVNLKQLILCCPCNKNWHLELQPKKLEIVQLEINPTILLQCISSFSVQTVTHLDVTITNSVHWSLLPIAKFQKLTKLFIKSSESSYVQLTIENLPALELLQIDLWDAKHCYLNLSNLPVLSSFRISSFDLHETTQLFLSRSKVPSLTMNFRGKIVNCSDEDSKI